MKGFIFKFPPLLLITFFLVACISDMSPSEQESKKLQSNNSVWDNATPRSLGFDEEALDDAFNYALKDSNFTQAALVIKDNKLVYEKYKGLEAKEIEKSTASITLFNRLLGVNLVGDYADKNSFATSWSMAKSITSVLIGIAVKKGYITSIDDPVSKYLDEWEDDSGSKNDANTSQKNRAKITLRHLLNMRSGLQVVCLKDKTLAYCNRSESQALGGDNVIIFADNQGDKCLKRPLVENKEGGTDVSKFVYSNCDSLLLGMVIEEATGKDLDRFAETELFSKLGIRETYWWRDSVHGRKLAYCCLDATPRDYAKFGQLIINDGVWNKKQILPKWYIDEIKKGAQNVVDEEGDYKTSYGLHFWSTSNKGDSDAVVYYTRGLGDQVIMMDFENKMVVVRNSIYRPVLDQSGQRVMNVPVESGISFSEDSPIDISKIDSSKIRGISLPVTLPLPETSNSKSFDFLTFYKQVKDSIKK